MPRPEKVQAVADIKERIEGAQAVFLAEYAGLSVKDQQTLRRELRANGAEFKVVKMTLARLAAGELEIDSLDELLLGPTGLAFADGDPVGAAKVLKDFAKEHDVFLIKGGLLGLEFLSPERIAELADIEPREVLLAKLAGAMKAPMANLAGLLAALPRNTASVLQQLLEKKEAEGQPTADSPQPTAEEETEAQASDDGEAQEAEAVADAPDAEEVPEAEADGDAPEAEEAAEADEASVTEDETKATAEASDDAGEESEDQADEASDDAEEE
jgi:large subunit ribosomal protein L10